MELNIINQSNYPIVALVSQHFFSNNELLEMIQPKQLMTKIAYDHYWEKKYPNQANNDLSQHLISQTNSLMMNVGRCPSTGDQVQLLNVNQVPSWGYIFYIKYENNRANLVVCRIPILRIFEENDTYLVSVYNIAYQAIPGGYTESHNEASQILNVSYSDPGQEICSVEADWVPKIQDSKSNQPWIMSVVLLILVFLLIAILVASFFVLYNISKKVSYTVNKRNVIVTQEKEVPKLILT